jgi:hypothetical protein
LWSDDKLGLSVDEAVLPSDPDHRQSLLEWPRHLELWINHERSTPVDEAVFPFFEVPDPDGR